MVRFGKRVALGASLTAALSVAPLQLYSLFGPERGNPLGLGFLALFGVYICLPVALLGAIAWVAGKFLFKR